MGRNAGMDAAERRRRTPPGQSLTAKWPVLHYGEIPRIDLATWEFRVWGQVTTPVRLDWAAFDALPRRTYENDIHCVTRWSRLDNDWEGVPIAAVVEPAAPLPAASHALIHCYGGYTTNVPVPELLTDEVFLAVKHSGAALSHDHGWPVRLVVPSLYFWKSAKWVRGIEFLDENRAGFWENFGYHMHGDPWREERFG